jgi:hydrogenase maturation protein HypF
VSVACAVRVRGVVQGVGFRPFVFRLARRNTLAGWVLNAGEGVDIHLEGADRSVRAFLRELERTPPPAAVITGIEIRGTTPQGFPGFVIRESLPCALPTVRIAPDLPVCDDCLRELFDPTDRRFAYPYINCTNCGPRYSIVLALPYDRPNTTMKGWPLDAICHAEYHDPENRRFHAQPVACPECGPSYCLQTGDEVVTGSPASIARAVALLRQGRILGVKGIGGYHLACDARDDSAVVALRTRKYRKEKPFALMVRDVETARGLVDLGPAAEALLTSAARPVVLAPARTTLPRVAPDNGELGVMLPYAPLHHLLFAGGAPDVMVMTSANRSSEPMAYEDSQARASLSGIADGFLIGQRPIARRVDDSVVRDGAFGPMVLRRSRGYSPGVVATLPLGRPILAVGADLKNAITLVVAGQAIVSQHIGDLEHHGARMAFERTIHDLVSMYQVAWADVLVAHDRHPEYVSTTIGRALPSWAVCPIQHHRAHIASVLAERQAWSKRVIGVSLDGTGYGEDGVIWGGELFAGSLETRLDRRAHLRQAALVGGDRAARFPVQAAAGFLTQVEGLPDLFSDPFCFSDRYRQSQSLLDKGLRVFPTTSMGRLFDAAAALLGFTRETTFEGQAAIWAEHLATGARGVEPYAFPFEDGELDFRPLLHAVAIDRWRGRDPAEIAAAFHLGVAEGVCEAVQILCEEHDTDTVVCSGGVFQNNLLSLAIKARLSVAHLQVWTNAHVPCNDGGISLGQAALASFDRGQRGCELDFPAER